MSSLALMFVGAVLLVNGLVLLDRIEAPAAVPVNLLVGAGLLTASLLAAIPAADDRLVLFGAVGYALFGVTYLTVAGRTLLGTNATALGWYCGWASMMSIVLALVYFSAGDQHTGWLWASWAVLFFAFFLSCCWPDPRFAAAAGVVAIAQSVTTATIPAALMIDASWTDLAIGWVVAAQVVGVLAAVAVGARTPHRLTI